MLKQLLVGTVFTGAAAAGFYTADDPQAEACWKCIQGHCSGNWGSSGCHSCDDGPTHCVASGKGLGCLCTQPSGNADECSVDLCDTGCPDECNGNCPCEGGGCPSVFCDCYCA
jgi:hypothetical protein